jgi:hypothetical protein
MDDESKKVILARRARFIAAAIAGVSLAGQACGGEATDPIATGGGGAGGRPGPGGGNAGAPQPCLQPLAGTYNVGGTGTPQPCLGAQIGGTTDSGGTSFVTGGRAGAGGWTAGAAGRTAGTGGTLGGSGGSFAGIGGVCLSGAAGVPQPCLQPPIGGTGNVEPCLTGGVAGEAGRDTGGTNTGGAGGQDAP